MPIAQSRMIALVAAADEATSAADGLFALVQRKIKQVKLEAYDPATALAELEQALPDFIISRQAVATATREKQHFAKHAKANERMAQRQRARRAASGHISRSELAILRAELDATPEPDVHGLLFDPSVPIPDETKIFAAAPQADTAMIDRMVAGMLANSGADPYGKGIGLRAERNVADGVIAYAPESAADEITFED